MNLKTHKILERLKCNDKIYFTSKIIFSFIFAVVITLDSLLVFPGTIDTNINTTYFQKIQIKNVLIFFGVLIGTYIIITLLEYVIDKLEKTIYTKKERKSKNIKVFFIIFGIILICWLPTILSYFPGGLYGDTVTTIREVIHDKVINNNNPILYTLCIKAFLVCGAKISSYTTGVGLFTVFQVLIMDAILSGSVYWMYKKNISKKYLVLVTLFYGICRLIPMYAISIWKDTPFSLALFLYTIFIAESVYQNGRNLETKKSALIIHSILIILVSFLRNNGTYIIIATTAIMILVYRKKMFSIVSIAVMIAILIIQGPVYKLLGLTGKTVESLGVPLQQLCYVAAKEDGNLTDEQKEFINNILNIDIIKQSYNPCLVDPVKWHPEFNNEFLQEHKAEFMKVWLEGLIQNPTSYVKAYLLNTLGFWDINKATKDAYVNPQMWNWADSVEVFKGEVVEQTDYVKKVTGKSVRKIITPEVYISSAVFLFITLFSALITIYKKKYKNLLIYLPALLTWATIMIAAPLAFSLRYVYILVLEIPMSFIIPFLETKQEKEEINEKSK